MIVGAEENVAGSRPTAFTSEYLVTAQKPGPSGSGCQWTGSWDRSHRNCSCGWPWAKDSGESRSMAGPRDAVVVMPWF